MPKPTYEFFDPKDLTWAPVPGMDGVSEQILARDDDTGAVSRLVRFEPGTTTEAAGMVTHDYWEEIYIVGGELEDLQLEETFSAGYYACRPPGMKHGPWRSENGVLMFEVRYYVAPIVSDRARSG
jgi:ChrR Cupin-like domain